MNTENKMAKSSVFTEVWKLGIPMVISMVLQALYNIVDTAFVINMDPILGGKANLALTYAFPVQIMMIALGVGTGVGINTRLSKYLGKNNQSEISKTIGNGIFLGLVMFVIFLLFGLFFARPFISFQCKNQDEEVIEMGATYLKIVCCLSLGNVGYTIYERFLEATGLTLYSMIAQISGAVCNIILDYIFIYPLNMGISGAAYATVIGQFLSTILAMIFHYSMNREVNNSFKDLNPNWHVIKSIYRVGLSAMIMQALLSIMMLGVNLILGFANNSTLLTGAFGIYYKIYQIPLFACFGLSNALITYTSFTYGRRDSKKLKEIYKWGIIDSAIISLFFTILFEILASPIAKLFGLASGETSQELVAICSNAIRIAAISYVFMGVTIAYQGVLQGLGYSLIPLLLSFFRLVLFVYPVIYLFSLMENNQLTIWFAFIISEGLTAIIAVFISYKPLKKKLNYVREKECELTSNQK